MRAAQDLEGGSRYLSCAVPVVWMSACGEETWWAQRRGRGGEASQYSQLEERHIVGCRVPELSGKEPKSERDLREPVLSL